MRPFKYQPSNMLYLIDRAANSLFLGDTIQDFSFESILESYLTNLEGVYFDENLERFQDMQRAEAETKAILDRIEASIKASPESQLQFLIQEVTQLSDANSIDLGSWESDYQFGEYESCIDAQRERDW